MSPSLNVPVNNEIVMGQEFTVLRNGSEAGNGFYDTPVGQDWNEKIYGKRNHDGFEFKMNLSNTPFAETKTLSSGSTIDKAVTVASPPKGTP